MNVILYSFGNSRALCKKTTRLHYGWRGFATSLTEHEEDDNVYTKYEPLEKLPCKPSFVKNLFNGKYDPDFLTFPKFLDEERLKLLDRNTDVVRKFVAENVNSAEIDETRSIPEDLIKKMGQMKLFGLSASLTSGGANFSNTERARIFEIISQDSSIGAMLFNHETCGHKLISKYGDDYHREKFLKPLVSGQMLSTVCFGESGAGSDPSHFDTYALRVGTQWKLSGSKVWVINADKADLFIVFAKVRYSQKEEEINLYYYDEGSEILVPNDIGVFLVESGSENIGVGLRYENFGLRGLSIHEVTFNDVIVPEKNVLTDLKKGYRVVKEFLNDDRFLLGCLPLGIMKNIQSDITKYSISRKLHGANLHHFGLTQSKISKVAVNTYAVESLIYYTAGLLDMYKGQDCELENAIVKVFSSEAAFEAVNEAMLLMGGNAFLESSPYYRYFRDLRYLALMDSTNDMYRCFIALNGLQYVSNELNDEVFVHRNPSFYTQEVVTSHFNIKLVKTEMDEPILDLKLREYLHPNLHYIANQYEYCVHRLKHGVMCFLVNEGPNTVNDQFSLKRLADAAILVYAMTAVLSRASKSYCMGCKNSAEELLLCETFVRESVQKFKYSVEGLTEGNFYCTDANNQKLSKITVQKSGYFLQEPLKLTY